VIVAIGQYQDNSFFPKDFFPELDRRGNPKVDARGKTAHAKVWACGDYVTNPLNFISAIGDAKRVAEEIVEQLRSLNLTGQYPPGSKLPPERELSKRLGVNRASLREALKMSHYDELLRQRDERRTRGELVGVGDAPGVRRRYGWHGSRAGAG